MRTKIFSPFYYDHHVVQGRNPYLKFPSSRKEKSNLLRLVATGERRSCQSRTVEKRDIMMSEQLLKKPESLEPFNYQLFIDYQHLNNQSKSCQTSSSLKRPHRAKRVISKSFISLSQQKMKKS